MALPDGMLEHLKHLEQLLESLNTRGAAHALEGLQSGRTQLEELMKLAEEQSEWEIQARAGLVLGRLSYRLGPWSSAGPILRAAWTAAANPGVNADVGVVAAKWYSELDMSLGYLQEANLEARLGLALARSKGSKRAVAAALTQLAAVEIRLDNYSAAERHLEEARTLHHTIDYSGRASVLRWMASIRVHQGRSGEALALRHEALECTQASGDAAGEAHLRMEIGNHYRFRKNHELASEWLLPAYSLAQETISPWLSARILSAMGELYEAQGKRDQAVAAWLRSAFIFRALGSPTAAAPNGYLHALAGLPGRKPPESILDVAKPGWHEIL